MTSTILIVDDSGLGRKLALRCLKAAGLTPDTCFEAGNGMEALTILEENEIDLVVTDINMPRMDGIALVRALNGGVGGIRVPVIIMSSVVEEGRLDDLGSLGVVAVVSKPLTPKSFVEPLTNLASA